MIYDIYIDDKEVTHGNLHLKRITEYLNFDGFSNFVETGTYKGGGVKWALNNNFTKVNSTELNEGLYNESSKLFEDNINIIIHNKDTVEFLTEITTTLKEKTVFFLDAHISGSDSSHNKNHPNPAIIECKILSEDFYDINECIIIIDDARIFDDNFKNDMKKQFDSKGLKCVYLDDTIIFCNEKYLK
jgi:hypothetical protein